MKTTTKTTTITKPQSIEGTDIIEHPVVKDFLELTEYTTPYPHDQDFFRNYLDKKGMLDEFVEMEGNFIRYQAGPDGLGSTLFIAHIDTADKGVPKKVTHVMQDGIVSTDGTTLLGADDKAGAAILLHMMREGVPGTYAFVTGEESGLIGSSYLDKIGFGMGFRRAIQFDRYGYDSIITEQMGEISCSDEFASALIGAYDRAKHSIPFKADPNGVYTDTYSFMSTIPECTNISVGYYGHHTAGESQDVDFLIMLAEASAEIDWESLPTEQDPLDRGGARGMWSNYWPGSGMGSTATHTRASLSGIGADSLLDKAEKGSLEWSEVYEYVTEHPLSASDLLYRLMHDYWDMPPFG